mmetsp:Transcript_3324/g.5566  ORF Transcript_3324/g.5566 Transcript_3324/m.5566 type:complete len:508 (-) Transcript_3324:32-1555(-)
MMPSQSPSPSGGDTELPPLPNLPPNKRTISLPNNNMMPNSFPTNASEGDWLQKLQLEQNNANGMLSNMGMPSNNFRGDAAKYGFGGDNSTAAGMANNSGNSASASAEGGGATSSSEREQMVAELRKMQAENEDLIRLISSRQQQQQQLGGSGGSGGGSGGTNGSINPMMMMQQQHQKVGGEGDNNHHHQLKSGGNSEGQSKSAAAGGSSTALSPTGGMNMNSAAAVMGGMMGMNNNINMMMMPYSTMMGGGMNHHDMMNLNNMMPYSTMTHPSMSTNTTNNSNNMMLPPSKSTTSSNNNNNKAAQKITIETSEDPNWEERYHELQLFKSEHGHTRVPARYKSNPKLGRWVMTQRRQFTVLMQGFPSALTTERMNRLNEIGFVWALRADPVTMWNRKFGELKAYKRLFGNCMVPQRYQPNPKLGTWVHTQRRQYKLMLEGKKSAMNNEKITALDSIGFFWMAKQKDGGAVAVGETTAAAGGSLPPSLPGFEGKSEGYGDDADEGSDDE